MPRREGLLLQSSRGKVVYGSLGFRGLRFRVQAHFRACRAMPLSVVSKAAAAPAVPLTPRAQRYQPRTVA